METNETIENTKPSTITRETFLLNELAHWIAFFKDIGRRNWLVNNDALICCDQKEVATLFDSDQILKGEVKFGDPFSHNNFTVTMYEHLRPEQLRMDEFLTIEEYQQFGFYHHKMLRDVLDAVENQFNPFINIIYEYHKDKLAVTEKPSQTAYLLIKEVLNFINTNTVKNPFAIIPDLFTFRGDISLMSYNENYIYDLLEEIREGKKYVYMFSRKTSESFGIVLTEILNKKLANQLEIAQFNGGKEARTGIPDFILPSNTKLRLDKLTEYFGLNQIRRQSRLPYKNGELIYLFRLLQDNKVLLGNDVLPKDQLVLAISILTGISPSILYNQYPAKEEIDLLKVMNRHTSEAAEEDAQKLKNKMKDLFLKLANKKL